ncbi:phosphoglycolate phosphatase [Azospirillum halopraeferens]|uniref:phosphoglycolate phosphatase n=1 Tax=Azospirillum halopraeferens TaxID=34010 RepID=UPI00041A8873|nr:phosphoglycolate phosphatase [Azospirillum halopraeferens]
MTATLPPGLPAILVFDLDGTLIDSAPDIARAVNATLAGHGRRALSVAEVRGMVGDGSASLLRQAFAATGAPLDEGGVQEALARYLDIYFAQSAEPSCLYPGVAPTLGALHAAGIALGLCTNKPERIARKLLDLLDLARLFGAVAGGDTLPVRKPDGRPLARVIDALGGGPAAMVGDNANDVKAARAVGIPVVAVSYGYPRMAVADLGADLVIDRFADLPAALARLGTRPDSPPAGR